MLDRGTILKPITISFRPWVIVLFVLCPPMWGLVCLALWGVPWDSPNTPAWVQAVGSIGAILIAIWIAARQGQQQADVRREEDAQMLRKVVGVARYAGRVCAASRDVAVDAGASQDACRIVVAGLGLVDGLLKETPYHMVPTSEAALGWIELRYGVDELRKGLNQKISDPNFGEPHLRDIDYFSKHASSAVLRICSASQNHLPELNLPD